MTINCSSTPLTLDFPLTVSLRSLTTRRCAKRADLLLQATRFATAPMAYYHGVWRFRPRFTSSSIVEQAVQIHICPTYREIIGALEHTPEPTVPKLALTRLSL